MVVVTCLSSPDFRCKVLTRGAGTNASWPGELAMTTSLISEREWYAIVCFCMCTLAIENIREGESALGVLLT